MKKICKILILAFVSLFIFNIKITAKLSSTTSLIYNGQNKAWRLEGNNSYGGRSEYFCLTKGSSVDSTCDAKYDSNDKNYGWNNEKLRAGIGRAILDYNWLYSLHVAPYIQSGNTKVAIEHGLRMYYGIQLVIHKFLAEKASSQNISGSLAFLGLDFTPHYNSAVDDYDDYDSSINVESLSFTQSGDYFISNTLRPSSNFGTPFLYNLTINGNSNSSYLEDYDYGKRIKIPISDVTSTMNINLNISTTRTFYLANFINCADGYQDIVNTSYRTEYKTIDKTLTAVVEPASGKKKIKKVNTAGSTINSEVEVDIYFGYGCQTYKETISFTGQRDLKYVRGEYSLKEKTAPPYYEKDENCYNFSIKAGDVASDDTAINIINKSTCVVDVLELIESGKVNDRAERIKIYNKYGGWAKHRNLLDFTDPYVSGDDKEIYATNACSSPENKKTTLDSLCLEVTSSADFNENKWTHYTEMIDLSSNTGYCNTLLSFNRAATIPWNPTTILSKSYYSLSNEEIKAGMFVFKSDILGTVTLTKECYFVNEVNGDIQDSYYNYVNALEFNDVPIIPSVNNSGNFNLVKQSYNNEIGTYYKGSITATYNLSDVKIRKLSGRICTDSAYDCVSKGAGILSEFQDGNDTEDKIYIMDGDKKYVVVPFSIDVNTNIFGEDIIIGNDSTSLANSCVYSVVPEIIKYDTDIKGKLELEFRSIDTNSPFKRDPNTNWDGNVGETGKSIIETYITDTNVNNSYNRTGKGSLYTNQTDGTKKIILTPDNIQQIREYNASIGSYEKSLYVEDSTTGKWTNELFNRLNIIKN